MDDNNVLLRAYVDSQLSEIRRAVEASAEASRVHGVPLQDYVEALLAEQARALETATSEREKAAAALREQSQKAMEKSDNEREMAAQALREQSQHAMDKADAERELAAKALRGELSRQIEQGDTSLRDHISTQIEQIKLLATSLDDQSRLRIEAVAAAVLATERAVEIASDASEKAIAKAETAAEKRFEAVDTWRQQSADQSANFLLREVADANFAELRKQSTQNTDRLNRSAGVGDRRQQQQPWAIWVAGAILAVVIVAVNLAVALAQ